jgi:ElaB/YqjD/DUF883 family membrane-anchored ribosome-binding protein
MTNTSLNPDTTAPSTTSPRDKLMADLKVVIADAEELLKMTAGQAGDKAADIRARMQIRLAAARTELSRLQTQAATSARAAGKAADGYVRENPWTAVGIGAGAGLLVGLLLSRR